MTVSADNIFMVASSREHLQRRVAEVEAAFDRLQLPFAASSLEVLVNDFAERGAQLWLPRSRRPFQHVDLL
eukprot:8669294-Lingulodinium_polyedra.AAC.1